MTQYLRAIQERSATSAEPGTPIRFVASTENVGRDGIVIAADGWDLDNFRLNPAFLWSHDYTGNKPPIGRVSEVAVKDGKLMADVMFDQGDEFARQIERKYRDGFLNAVSVGWDTKQVEPPRGAEGASRVTRAELLDLSAVNIPGDPNALIQRQLRALQEIVQATETTEETPSPARATWDETAASMVRLICTAAQRPETERTTEYRALAREYARHGKTPPELLEAETVTALGSTELRGLFLEGEPDLFPNTFALAETRAGAVLSKRNLDDLQRAKDLIDGVMARAVKEAETGEPDPEPVDDARALLLAFHNVTKTKELNHA